MESSWLAMAKRLLAIAATGKEFTQDQYDHERYLEISSIALDMLAQLGRVPIKSVKDLFDLSEPGYVTPKVEVRAAILKNNEILLIQEKEDGLWAMPGGYADIGLSPAENVEKEVLEEAGIQVKATHLYAVRHKAKGDYPPDPRDFYKLHFLCEQTDSQLPHPGLETQSAAYFHMNDLPPLALSKNLKEDLLSAMQFSATAKKLTYFD